MYVHHKCNIFKTERILLVFSFSTFLFQKEDFLLFIAYSSFEYQVNACICCLNMHMKITNEYYT